MIAFIDDHREAHGVEPICKVLQIAPSTYYDHEAARSGQAVGTGEAGYGSQGRGSSKRTSVSTACARRGGNCSGKASMSLAALLSG